MYLRKWKSSNLIKLDARSISHNSIRLAALLLRRISPWLIGYVEKARDLNHNCWEKSRSFSLLAIIGGKSLFVFLFVHDINTVILFHTWTLLALFVLQINIPCYQETHHEFTEKYTEEKLYAVNNESRWSACKHDVESVLLGKMIFSFQDAGKTTFFHRVWRFTTSKKSLLVFSDIA